jgi:hypothetical protein
MDTLIYTEVNGGTTIWVRKSAIEGFFAEGLQTQGRTALHFYAYGDSVEQAFENLQREMRKKGRLL